MNTNTNTKEFKGVKRNVGMTKGSISAANIERLQRSIMKGLYTDEHKNPLFMVVKAIDVDEIGQIHMAYQTVGLSPVVLCFGELESEPKQLSVRKLKDDAGNYYPDKEVKVAPDNKYRLYNNIILVSFRGTESFYEKFRIEGIKVDGKEYYPASCSNSMSKGSRVFFTNHDAEHQFSVMNDLTGGLLQEVLDTFEGKEMSKDDLANIQSRISLAATTPTLWPESGVVRNVFYFDKSVESANEQSDCPFVDNNFRDGYGVKSDRIASEMATELAGEKVSCIQARHMSWQDRVRGVAGKGHFLAYNIYNMIKEMKEMIKIDMSSCHLWIDCKKVNIEVLSEKELDKVLAQVDIIGDKDVFKWGKFIKDKDTIKPLRIGVVNMSNKTEGHMGTQLLFKLRYDVEDAIKYIRALVNREVLEEAEARNGISFKKDKVRLNNTVYFNIMATNPEKAELDRLLSNYKLKCLDTALLGRIANLKLKIDASYLRMVPEDSLLNDQIEVLGSRMVHYVMPAGPIKEFDVRAIEVYSPTFDKRYHELKAMVEANPYMTDKEKDIILNNSKVMIKIKSPSQGDKEFEVAVMVTLEELKARGCSINYINKMRETPKNCEVWCQDNTVKRQLAGSDFDGDDNTDVHPEVCQTEDGKLHTGMILDNEIINDYTSILVRRRYLDDNKGVCTLIEYHSETPIRFGKTVDKKDNSNIDTAADFLRNSDISSLF